ncbi:MAG TPA: sulfotransferase [Mycobacterium sp.]|nr:sulfotransferase [Mycobacterium sp.]
MRSHERVPAGPTGTPPGWDAAVTDLRHRLSFVTVAERPAADDRFPHFMVLGPQRTGTTWLYEHLGRHPQVMMPACKATRYFSTLDDRGNAAHRSTELAWYLSHFRESWWDRRRKSVACLWRTGEQYAPAVYGEATASYAALPDDVLADVAVLNPRLKAVMIVRDPVARAWSHAKKDLLREPGRRLEEVPEAEFERFFTDPYIQRCGQATANLDRWAGAFGPDAVFVGWFSDLARRPAGLLSDVMTFLGVRAGGRYLGRDHRRRVNPTEACDVPPRLAARLDALFGPERAALVERFGRFD